MNIATTITLGVKKAAIFRFLKPEVAKDHKVYGREMKLITELTALYPDPDFWMKAELTFKLNSLAWFKSPEGAAALKSLYQVFHLHLPPSIEVDKQDKSCYDSTSGNPPLAPVLPKPQSTAVANFLTPPPVPFTF